MLGACLGQEEGEMLVLAKLGVPSTSTTLGPLRRMQK
jgi:hypothetical protein